MPLGLLRSEMLRTQMNYLFAPLIPYLEFNHYLIGVMHFGHNILDQFLSAVFKDVDALHGDDANLIKYDVIKALRNMGAGILPPASPRARATEQSLPKCKGGDLSILRADLGMLTILQLVYGADEVLDQGAPAEEPSLASARDRGAVSALEEAMLARRGNRQPSARVLAAVRSARTSALRRACRALMLLWEVHHLLKKTDNDDSTAPGREMHAHARHDERGHRLPLLRGGPRGGQPHPALGPHRRLRERADPGAHGEGDQAPLLALQRQVHPAQVVGAPPREWQGGHGRSQDDSAFARARPPPGLHLGALQLAGQP